MNNNKILLDQINLFEKDNINSKFYAITFIANTLSLIYNSFEDINWIGIYLLENDNLVLGPFLGKPACTFIKKGKGVCGKCIEDEEMIIVNDVSKFDGHIACDALSKSEIVVPIKKDGKIVFILDVDSKIVNYFDKDKIALIAIISEKIEQALKK